MKSGRNPRAAAACLRARPLHDISSEPDAAMMRGTKLLVLAAECDAPVVNLTEIEGRLIEEKTANQPPADIARLSRRRLPLPRGG